MAEKTGIEWTDSTWSPIRVRVKADAARIAGEKGYTSLVQIAGRMAGHVGQHCEHVSPGCEHCYAETNNHRCLPANGTGLPYDRRSRDLVDAFVDEKQLLAPLKWGSVIEHVEDCLRRADRGNQYCGCSRPRRIFVENQSDLFGEWVTDEMIDGVFAVMALCPQHKFQVLTKRPARMLEYFLTGRLARIREAMIGFQANRINLGRTGDPCLEWSGVPLPNVWLGTTVENQAAAAQRFEPLRQFADAGWQTWVSSEPRLGAIDWKGWEFLRWMVSGGESGKVPGIVPSHPDWFREDCAFCEAHGASFFFKQWGEWKPISEMDESEHSALYVSNRKAPEEWQQPEFDATHGRRCTVPVEYMNFGGEMGLERGFQVVRERFGMTFFRVGKVAAGALLDGAEHRAFPQGM